MCVCVSSNRSPNNSKISFEWWHTASPLCIPTTFYCPLYLCWFHVRPPIIWCAFVFKYANYVFDLMQKYISGWYIQTSKLIDIYM
jgi:hypothetical protein